jgi:hypothetical protein
MGVQAPSNTPIPLDVPGVRRVPSFSPFRRRKLDPFCTSRHAFQNDSPPVIQEDQSPILQKQTHLLHTSLPRT